MLQQSGKKSGCFQPKAGKARGLLMMWRIGFLTESGIITPLFIYHRSNND